jgi:phosphonate transport system ATP-binding protein
MILADEPIASLDVMMQAQIMSLISEIARRDGLTIVMSLHQIEVAKKYADRIIALAGGRIAFDGPPAQLTEEVVQAVYRSAPRGVVVTAQSNEARVGTK